MMKKLLNISGVIALYKYTLPYKTIPLLIVKDFDVLLKEKEKGYREQGSVILTEDDIKEGKDVFSLRFLHMQKHTEFVGGRDIFQKMKLKKKYIRHSVELSLRVFLIDLREMILIDAGETEYMGSVLALSLDRIMIGVEKIGKKTKALKTFKKLSIRRDRCRKETLDKLFLKELYKDVEKLTVQVNAL